MRETSLTGAETTALLLIPILLAQPGPRGEEVRRRCELVYGKGVGDLQRRVLGLVPGELQVLEHAFEALVRRYPGKARFRD